MPPIGHYVFGPGELFCFQDDAGRVDVENYYTQHILTLTREGARDLGEMLIYWANKPLEDDNA